MYKLNNIKLRDSVLVITTFSKESAMTVEKGRTDVSVRYSVYLVLKIFSVTICWLSIWSLKYLLIFLY